MESNKLKKLHENGDFIAKRAVMKQDEEAGTQIPTRGRNANPHYEAFGLILYYCPNL